MPRSLRQPCVRLRPYVPSPAAGPRFSGMLAAIGLAAACIPFATCATTRQAPRTITPTYSILMDEPAVAARILMDETQPLDEAALGRLADDGRPRAAGFAAP